ncbi:MAG: mechanosensitive ion channel family protein, partial [Planctomycetota bacterium]
MIRRSIAVVACIAIALSSPSPASGQEPQEAEFTVPSKPEEAVAVDVGEMHEKIKDLPTGKLAALLSAWMSHVERQQTALKTVLSADKGSDERKRADAIGSDRDALIARAEAVIEVLVKKGGDVARARQTIADIRTSELARIVAQSTVPQDRTTAQDLDVDVLQAQLRPLTKEQVENQLKEWMALLQKQCLEVRKVEVASMASEDAESIDKYNVRAVELRYQRDDLIRRVEVVIAAFKDKGGDVKDAQAYVNSVVAAPQITGLRATWTTFRAWLVNPEGGAALAKSIAFFIVILIAFRILGGILASLLDRAMRSMKNSSELLRTFFVNATRKLTILIGLVVAVSQLGVNIGPLLAAIGAAGFVLGFALQGTLSNFAAGLMLLMYRPYNLGDVVTVGGTTGKVDGQNLVSTTIKTFDNKTVIVPNNMIWGDVITNATASPTRRVDMIFGIGYSDDIARAEGVLMNILTSHEQVLSDPEPVVQVHELGDSSVNFVVRPWVRTEDYWDVYWDITRMVKQRFDAEQISIPSPQRDIHVHHEAAGQDTREDTVVLPRPEPVGAEETVEAAQQS